MNRILDLRKKTPPPPPPAPRQPQPALPPSREPILRPNPAPTQKPPVPVSSSAPGSPSGISWHFASQGDPRSIWLTTIGLCLLTFLFAVLGQVTLALVMGFGAVALFFQRVRHTLREVRLLEYGIMIDGRTHLFKDIKSFWVHYAPGGIQELSIEMRGWYIPYLRIPLSGKNPVRIREFLIGFIPEREHPQSLIDALLHRMGL